MQLQLSSSDSRRLNLFTMALLVLAGIVFLIYPKWTVDDAWISYRYGQNLVNHGELNWNPGEDPVEGYTGLLLPLLAATLTALGIAVVPAVKIISVLLLGVALLDLRRTLIRTGASVKATSVALALSLFCPLIFIHTLSGLETTLFMLAILAAVDSLVQHVANPSARTGLRLSILSLFACLVRPEGMLLALVVAVIAVTYTPREKALRRTVMLLCFFAAVPVVVWFFWRMNYYGRLLPNTFYAKQSTGLFEIESIKSLIKFGLAYWILPLGLGILMLAAGSRNEGNDSIRETRRAWLLAVLLFSVPVMLVYLHSNLWMNFSWRFFMPFYPLAMVPLAWGLDRWVFSVPFGSAAGKMRSAVAGLFLLLQGLLWIPQLRYDLYFVNYYQDLVESEWQAAGRWLGEHLNKTEWIVCFKDAGAIPWESGLRTVDFGYLNDEFLSQPGLSYRQRCNYFYARNPGALIFTSTRIDQFYYLEEADSIMADPRFDNYTLFAKFSNNSGYPYYQFLYLRNDLATKWDPPGKD